MWNALQDVANTDRSPREVSQDERTNTKEKIALGDGIYEVALRLLLPLIASIEWIVDPSESLPSSTQRRERNTAEGQSYLETSRDDVCEIRR